MKICLRRIIVFCAMLSFGSGLLAQTASLSPTLTTATCAHPACTWKAFGPVTYMRLSGEPQTVTDSFAVLNPDTQFTLHIDNDGVASAVISINGTPIFGPSDFDPHLTTLDRAVTLRTNNAVAVELRGKPGASLTITVVGVDNDPPSIIELAAPLPNAFGWNNTDVQINFSCSDATSGISSCPNSLFLTNEGLNQVISETVFDRAGNSSTSTIQVSIDKTPPTIAVNQSPAANSAGWNNSPVTVNFTCADALSGIASCPSNISVSTEGVNQQVSGTTVDRAGNSSGTSIQLNIDQTPPVIGISAPANGATATTAALPITGTVSDNLSGVVLVSCNGAIGVFSGSVFTCNVSLVAGANAIQVQATDNAGNVATTQITVTLNANPPPPPKSILITPSTVNMLVGDTHPVRLVGDIGQVITGATWSISDPTIVSIDSSDPPQLTALGQGTATLTATFNGLTAPMTINVVQGAALPAGTALWSFDPLPGNTITQMVPGNPVNAGDPDIFAVEAPNTLRAFTKDGLQLWAVSLGASSGSATTRTLSSAVQQQNASGTQSQSLINSFDATRTLASIPDASQDVLRKHGAFDSLDLMHRQQRLIEQQRRRASPRNAGGAFVNTDALSPLLTPSSAAASDLPTLLIKAVPDNSGGIVNLMKTFAGCCSLIQTSFIKIDTATQQQVWRHDFSGKVDENFAIGADSTVYSSQVISSGTPSIFGSPTTSLVFALDATTGQQKFSLPLPPGHFKFTDTEGIGSNPTVIVLADLDVAAQPSPLSILPDGSINAVVATNHLEEDFQRLFSGGGSETAVSDHKTLQLLTIQPDGSFTNRPIQAFDFDQTGCLGFCKDPGAGYIPNEVIPDGQGGVLASWTGNDAQLGITSTSAALVRHFDNAGGSNDYLVPFASSSWFSIGGNNPESLVLGENNIAFASDGQSVIAFDVNTGIELWSFKAPAFQGLALVAATVQGGLTAIQLADIQGSFDANPSAIVSFDSTGAINAAYLFVGANPDLSYFDPNTLLAVAATGQAEALHGFDTFLNEANIWNLPNGSLEKDRKPNASKIEIEKLITFPDNNGLIRTTNLPLVGIGTQQPEAIRITSNQALNPSSKFTVELNIQTIGSGSAIFSDGSTSMKISPTQQNPAVVELQGLTVSSKANDMTLTANVMNNVVAIQRFSVVSVQLSIKVTGHVSSDNSVRDKYVNGSGVGSDSLGPVIIPFSQGSLSGCRTAVELLGTVTPTDYKGKVVLRRKLLESSRWVNTTFQFFSPAQPDTSPSANRDDDPGSSNGHAYDLDLPGLGRAQDFIGLVKRFRQNFTQFAVLDSADNTVAVSQHLSWYSRTSCNVTNTGPQFINDIPGDNQAGQGCTKLSLDLQSNDHAGTVCTQIARRATRPSFRLASFRLASTVLTRPTFTNFTLQKCELLAKSSAQELIQYLKTTNPEGSDPQCIEFAIKQLGDAKSPDSAPVLALYLTFRRTETDLEKEGMASGALGTPDNDFPAVWALEQLGTKALPTLANAIEAQKHTSKANKNAAYAVAMIFNEDAGAIKFLLHRAATARSKVTRQRFTAAAREALRWCREANRSACESAFGEASK